MNFNSTNPRRWKRLVILWEGPTIVNLETNTGLVIQAEAAYIKTHIVIPMIGNHSNVRGIDTVASHKW